MRMLSNPGRIFQSWVALQSSGFVSSPLKNSLGADQDLTLPLYLMCNGTCISGALNSFTPRYGFQFRWCWGVRGTSPAGGAGDLDNSHQAASWFRVPCAVPHPGLFPPALSRDFGPRLEVFDSFWICEEIAIQLKQDLKSTSIWMHDMARSRIRLPPQKGKAIKLAPGKAINLSMHGSIILVWCIHQLRRA